MLVKPKGCHDIYGIEAKKWQYVNKVIDDYFSMYGYKVNSLKTPNIPKRSNWDYIKCIDVNIEGDVPEADLDKIRSLSELYDEYLTHMYGDYMKKPAS